LNDIIVTSEPVVIVFFKPVSTDREASGKTPDLFILLNDGHWNCASHKFIAGRQSRKSPTNDNDAALFW
jgi:hypothetical protein